MDLILWQSFLVAFVGSVLSLDRTAALQIMISRPIVAAPVIGYMLGDTAAGLLIGCVLELLFIGGLPVGAYIPPHETMIAMLVTGISIIVNNIGFARFSWKFGESDMMILVISATLLTMLPIDIVCKRVDTAVRVLNTRFFYIADKDLGKCNIGGIILNNMKGLGVFFILNFLTLFVLTLAGVMVVSFLFKFLPLTVIMLLALFSIIALIISLSSAYNAVYGKGSLPLFFTTIFFGFIMLILMRGR